MSRVCLLTGASGPLGAAFIEACGVRYDIVAVHHRRPVFVASQVQEFVDPLDPGRELPSNARRAYTIRADISSAERIEAVVEEAVDAFGRIDLLVNAAAVRRFAPLLADGAQGYAPEMLSVNVLAPLWFSMSLARGVWRGDPADNERHNRNVVNVSSTAGLFVYPDTGQALYATSKAALNHLTYHLASELWDLGVRVNAVAPDTFPGRVPIEDVVQAIVEFDGSTETGQVRALQPADAPPAG